MFHVMLEAGCGVPRMGDRLLYAGESQAPQKPAPEDPNGNESILVQFRDLWDIILDPHAKRDLLKLGAAIAFVIALNAVAVQIRLNNWSGDIYNAIDHGLPAFRSSGLAVRSHRERLALPGRGPDLAA